MGKAVKSVTKIVKKVAPYALAGAAIYYGGPMLAAEGFTTSTMLSAAGLGLQAYSGIQAQKYQKKQSRFEQQKVEAANKADAARNRYNQLVMKRSRYQSIRAARIAQAQVGGGYGSAVGAGGTSGYVGAIGSIGTQASVAQGNINVAQDVGNQITNLKTMSANYGSQANQAGSRSSMWSDIGVLGGSIFESAGKLFDSPAIAPTKSPSSGMPFPKYVI